MDARESEGLRQDMLSIMDNMPCMTFIKDAKTGVYLACNQAFAAYAHKNAPVDVVGLTDADIFDAETAAHFVDDDRIALSMDRPYIFFEDVADAVGCKRQFQTTKLKYTDPSGRLCLQGMCQDVTDMVRIQRENVSTWEAYERAHSNSVMYSHIANALARGYTDLFYVNMETDQLIEFHTDDGRGVLSEARRSGDFFEGCERDAKLYIHPDDQEKFVSAMKREYLEKVLANSRYFEMTYRRIKEGRSFYVCMRVSRMEDDRRILVIAVSDIDELTKKRRAEERIREERVVYARFHALTGNFLCVYVVDPQSNHYHEFSSQDGYSECFSQKKTGTDFFGTVRKEARQFNHPEDQDRFLLAFTKENILEEVRENGIFTLDYRVLMDGKPLHVQMKAAMVEEKEGQRLIVGLNNVDAQYRQREIDREIARQKEIYNQITASLAKQYDCLYYIDMETDAYREVFSTEAYKWLKVPSSGEDFYAECRKNVSRFVHPEDQEKAIALHSKSVMLESLKEASSFSTSYRLLVDGKIRNIRVTVIRVEDGKYLVVCVKNIDQEVRARLVQNEDRRKRVTYTQIAERLASHYDFIYYIDCENQSYSEFSTKQKSGELRVQSEGDNFFEASRMNAERLVHEEDRDRIRLFLDRDNLISQLETRRQLTEDYRMLLPKGGTQYTRMSVTYSSDHSHFIICVENREKDVRREQEHLKALSMANEIARRDELTRTKNKTAYLEMEKELQGEIDGANAAFGLVVCDINGLKVVNDTQGHKAGDNYIKACCKLICRVFSHSPVFRIGGDEFVVVLKGEELEIREELLADLRRQVEENDCVGEGPSVASGMAVFSPSSDKVVEDVFNRADTRMYENKAHLKEKKILVESLLIIGKAEIRVITQERRDMLDSLFKALEVIAEGSYVFLCDMKYDYSHWSKGAVDAFGLPSVYMYGAGEIWENRIHEEDREAYRQGIDQIFFGDAAGHDMRYRAKRLTGEYDACICRGVVIRDGAGKPDYFAGIIRDLGVL